MARDANLAMPDRLSEAMVATASAYFVDVEDPRGFRQAARNLYMNWRAFEARAVLAAGLLTAGFTIEVSPLQIDSPEATPEEALDTRQFRRNWYNVVATIVDMGVAAISSDSPTYDEKLADRVVHQLD